MTVHFVRHGESTWNVARLIQGQTLTPELTARGVDQAHEVAASLAPLGVRRIVASDAARAQQTAAIIGARLGLEVESTPLLRERHWGIFQGGGRAEALAVEAGLAPDEPLEGGESRHDVRERWREVAADLGDGPVVVVTHGGFISEALADFGIEVDTVPNCSVTTVSLSAARR
jgi:broad specificity phosphatase PhoE